MTVSRTTRGLMEFDRESPHSLSFLTHERSETERVKFVGRSKVMRVTGEHILTPSNGGTRIENRFVVEGQLPGVERFFERSFGDELENLRTALVRDLGTEVT